ncbi:MAG TPA: hypothetical protein VE968_09895, partial [Sphingomicrobium sp.]|nr:hypothetical protein [Sphingomicrobium sp.]
MMDDGEDVRFDWRRGGAAALGLLAALILMAMVFAVKLANDAREQALSAERHSYEVALIVRNVSANISKAEAALARFVLDENPKTSGNIYASDWQLAGYQIDQLKDLERNSPAQLRRVAELERLFDKRDQELSLAAHAALARQGDTGIRYFYQASHGANNQPSTGDLLEKKLDEIIRAERASRAGQIEQSDYSSAQADNLTSYLSWLGIIVG